MRWKGGVYPAMGPLETRGPGARCYALGSGAGWARLVLGGGRGQQRWAGLTAGVPGQGPMGARKCWDLGRGLDWEIESVEGRAFRSSPEAGGAGLALGTECPGRTRSLPPPSAAGRALF